MNEDLRSQAIAKCLEALDAAGAAEERGAVRMIEEALVELKDEATLLLKESRRTALREMMAMWEEMLSQEQHREGVLHFVNGIPDHASGCIGPGGIMTDAFCVAYQDGEQVWLRPLGPHTRMHRRGRLVVDPGAAPRFIDDPTADVSEKARDETPTLERDLAESEHIRACCKSKLFGHLLYAALSDVEWRHKESGEIWSSSSRNAAAIIAGLKGEGTYMDCYLSGHEGKIDEIVLSELSALGWEPVNLDKEERGP